MSYIYFVTLNTGSAERISALDANVTQSAALDLGRALRDGKTEIAGRPGYHLQAVTVGPALLGTIYKVSTPLATFGAAARSRGANDLWRMLHETSQGYGLRTDAGSPPQTPWCAVRVEPGLMTDLTAAAWLASYEAEVATAWIEKRHIDDT